MASKLIEIGEVDTQAIRDEHVLSEVVSQYVALKRAGAELKACCPFHPDRSPSFFVNDDKQFYHCFGCGAHGDVIRFIQDIENKDFRGAVEKLSGAIIPLISADRIEELRERQRRAEAEDEARRGAATAAASERWIGADLDYLTHPYLDLKGIGTHGTRLEGDKILIPLIGADNRIQTLQSIDRNGRKLFVSDAPVSGGLFVLGGKVAEAKTPVIVCEGFATAATLREATEFVVVCAFNSGNLLHVARRLIEKYPDKEYIVCGDDDRGKDRNPGREKAIEASYILKCRAVFPSFPDGDTGTDFNDMAATYDQAAVRALVIDNILPGGEEAPDNSLIKAVDAFDFDEAQIPVRPWIIPGVMMARHTHLLAAPGASGKSLFTLQLAISLATGMQWGDWTPRYRCKVLIINAEDDVDEQRRRLAAARDVMKPDSSLLKGMMWLADEPESIVVSTIDQITKRTVHTPIVNEIIAYIEKNDIQVLIVDPFAETFEGDENSNSDVKWAMKAWRDIARRTGCAVYLVHHVTKYAPNGAGNVDVIRGGGAITNSCRVASTLFTMTEDEAEALGIEREKRVRYVRFDDAKTNHSLISKTARWFEKLSITIRNGGGFNEPDQVGALSPWQPPSAFAGASVLEMRNALFTIERGLDDEDGRPSGILFTARSVGSGGTSSNRWAGQPVMAHMGVNEEKAKLILAQWVRDKILTEVDFDHPKHRKPYKGLALNRDLMPTERDGF